MYRFDLIGFCGPAEVGKTTAASIISSELGYRMLGFADPIRETVLQLIPAWDDCNIEDGIDIRNSLLRRSPRDLMRIIGDHARSLQWDIYIRRAERRVSALREEGVPGVVIHDLRTEQEANWVREYGGRIIHLKRDGVSYRADHPTEMRIYPQPCDTLINNYGSINGLRRKLLCHHRSISSWIGI